MTKTQVLQNASFNKILSNNIIYGITAEFTDGALQSSRLSNVFYKKQIL